MTGSRTPPAAPSSGLLARYHHALPRLAVLLRGAELSASPDRWQNVYDLLVALNAQGRLPQQATKLEPLLAPLLCSSAREQQQFGVLFKRWLADPETDLPGPEDGAEAAEIRQEPEPPPAPRLRWWLIGLAALLAVLIAAFYWDSLTQQQGGEQPIPPVEPIAPRPSPGGEPPPPEAPGLEPQPVPPRTRLETPTLDAEHGAWLQTLGELLLLLPGFFALAWLLLRWLTWKTVLERRQGDPDDPLTAIGLDARIDDLLDAPALRDTLKRLHTPVAVPTRRLDAEATVACTARHAGLFQPVRRHRRIVPELVILIEQRHACDQMAGLAGQLVDRLRSAGLTVSRYDYRDSPRKVVGLDGRWRPLGEVASRHEGARLLLVGEPAALIDPFSEDLLSWTRSLAPWPERGLLVTRRPPERWQLALIESGFLVAELDSAGIQTIALQFADRRALSDTPISRVTVPLPRLLQDARRWVQPVALATSEVSSLLGALDVFLDEEGTRLLTAMAAYPQLHWGLTRVLDLSLFPGGDPIARERRLLKVARLPWSRAGWLPDWLRSALLERLERAAERDVRRLYRGLLQRETTAAGNLVALPVNLPRAVGLRAGLRAWLRHKRRRLDRWLAGLRVLSAEYGALNDAIFADVLFGWHVRLLDFVIPRRLLRPHMGGALGQALMPRLLLAIFIALSGAWLAGRAWHGWGREMTETHLLAMQNAAHAAYHVTIWRRKETAELAKALKDTLKADGFTTNIAGTLLAPPPEDAEPPLASKIQWGDAADVPMAAHIEQRLSYLSWGHDPELTDKLGALAAQPGLARPLRKKELRVLLLTPGHSGSSFRDSLAHTLTPEEIAALAKPSQPPQPAPATQPSEAPSQPQAPAAPDAAAAVQQLQAQIGKLEQRLAEVRREMQLERTGADGRAAGKGPNYRRLSEEAQSIEVQLREARRALQASQGEATGQRAPPAATIELGQTFRDDLKDGGVGPEMVMLPGGSFQMGSPADEPERNGDEGPQHRVTVRPFAMSRTEVSFADYDRFAEATGRKQPYDAVWGRGDRPVINVSWNDAKAYAEWLSGQTGKTYRLPTEAEWEYAARGGTDTPFWTGRCIHTDQANYDGNYDYNGCGAKTGVYRAKTVPTGSQPANVFGLREVAGNVWEWVEDCYHPNYEGAPTDGSAWLEAGGGDCARRVLRGGGWASGRGASAPPTATGSPRMMPSTTAAFVSPGHPDPVSFVLCPFILSTAKTLRIRRYAMGDTKDAAPQAVVACHDLLAWIIPQLDTFPRARRFTLGERIESGLLYVLERLIEAAYSSGQAKAAALHTANLRLDVVRHLWRLGHALKALPGKQYGYGAGLMEGLGRQIGAWHRGSLARSDGR